MYISNVEIENYKCFKKENVDLNPYSTLIGENDSGKTNFLQAINIVLNNDSIDYRARTLSEKDINTDVLLDFENFYIKNYDEILKAEKNSPIMKKILDKIPIVSIKLTFCEPANDYEIALLKDWLYEICDDNLYCVQYIFEPKDKIDFIKKMVDCVEEKDDKSKDIKIIRFPIEEYHYSIISTKNSRKVNFDKMKNFNMQYIKAERDTFSANENRNSYNIISKLANSSLSPEDKKIIEKAYKEFFYDIQEIDALSDVFDYIDSQEFDNIKDIVSKMELFPNAPNIKNIFSNITIGYEDEYLFQKGLGKRNFILMLMLFSLYKKKKERLFNLIAIEEPEAHLCINNLNIIIDFFEKNINKMGTLNQVLITSHNPKTINKLKINKVVVFSKNKICTLKNDVSSSLLKYIAKRPNFDTLKLLMSNNVILVEGISEEMLINTFLKKNKKEIIDIEIIVTGQKGFKTFLDFWLIINKYNSDRQIGIIRDFDNEANAKNEHDSYDENNDNVFVRTTTEYSLEEEIISIDSNCKNLMKFWNVDTKEELLKHMKNAKANCIYEICNAIDDDTLILEQPKHIKEVIECLMKKDK